MPREVEVHITVVICTWNRCELLRQTLEQMTRLVIPPRVRWSVVVVDNNSTDDTATVIESFGGCLPIRRVFEPTPGQSHARNAGLREAEGDFILWTDDDVLLNSDWLVAFFEATERHPEGAVFGGPCEPWFPVKPLESVPLVQEPCINNSTTLK